MSIKRIGILTYHHVANWGSVLQTVCLFKFLSKLFPNHQIELINYIPTTSEEYNITSSYKNGKKFGLQRKVKNKEFLNRRLKCQEFLNKNVTFSSEMLISDSLEKGTDFLRRQSYDKIFVGSDTVFQLGPYCDQYISAPQAPNLYFLPFKSDIEKFGFAVSVDPFISQHLDNIDKKEIQSCLKDFNYIFYRDETTCNVLKELNVPQDMLNYLPDPSLLIDFELFCVEDSFEIEYENLAAVAVGNSVLADQIIETLKQMGYTPVNLIDYSSSKSAISTSAIDSIESLINLHKRFELVVTDRFHGSIKALVMGNCPVIAIEDARKYIFPNSKIRDLFQRLGIEDMVVRFDDESINSEWIESMINKWKLNRTDIMKTIMKLRLQAYENLSIIQDF